MIPKKYVIILVLLANYTFAQLTDNSRFDSLSGKSFEYLKNRYETNIYNRTRAKIYAIAWLKKAKSEQDDYLQLALAYKASILNADKSSRLIYVDSMIRNAKRTNDDELIGSSYMTKGIIYYDRMQHMKALDNYLIADQYISRVNNPAMVYKVKYGIALIKYYLGFYDEAISLFRECIVYFKDENDRAYLNSLHCLGLCYNQIGKYQLATATNLMGISDGRTFEDTGIEFYFNHSEGINQCAIGNYTDAIKKLKSALPGIIDLNDFTNEAVAYFYIGKSYWSLKRYNEAITYFKKIDYIFQKEKYILPDLRRGYEYLIDYYKQKSDTQSQLFYINQLLKVDKVLADDYKYLLKKIVKEYDTKELLNEKNAIENTMVFSRIIACVIVLIMAFVIIHLTQKNRRNKKLFEELMNRNTANHIIPSDTIFEESQIDPSASELAEQFPGILETESNDKTSRTISPDVEAAIVKKLEKFELNKKYLEKDMTVRKMASLLNTNDKYVTKVIAKHRGKGTIEYITDLKLDYIVEMLKTESRYRNYTHKALGEEAGFRTTQNFTRAFKSHTGITPTYFIYKLKKSINTDSSA